MTTVICPRCDTTSNAADARFCRLCGARLPRISQHTQPHNNQPDANQRTLHSAPTLLQPTTANDALIDDDDPLGLTADGDDEATRVQTPPAHTSHLSRRPIHVPIPPRIPHSPAEILDARRAAMPPRPFVPPPPSKAKNYLLYFVGIALAVSLGVWFALRVQDENAGDDATATPNANLLAPNAVNPNDASTQNLVTAQLEAAADLLSRGDAPRAIELLRLVIASDPKNSQAYLQLGEALEITGNRSAAIAAYTDAVRNAPTLTLPLQRLAAANFAAAKFPEAAANYQALLALPAAKNTVDDTVLLRAAEAYRAAGQIEAARKLLTLLAASKKITATRDLARRTLAELDNLALLSTAPPSSLPAPDASPATTPNTGNAAPNSSPTPDASAVATASLPPAERFRRAIQLWTRDRTGALPELRAVAAEVPEANYYLGLSYAEGRDPQELARPELLAALRHFQLARNTQFSQQARRYEEQLAAEYDKRRSQ